MTELPLNSAADPSKHSPWLHWLDACPSTNTWAIAHTSELAHGDVVFTQQQTAGRGQQGRVWVAPAGVLTASFVIDRVPVAQLPGLSLAAGLAVIRAIEALLPNHSMPLRLKWPNDVLVNDRKLAGVLCEAGSGSHSSHTRVIVGIGLNRWVDWQQSGVNVAAIGNPVSLHEWCLAAACPDDRALLAQLRQCLLEISALIAQPDAVGITALLPELERRDALRDRAIVLEHPQARVVGHAKGTDAWGRLLVQSAEGQVQAFASGRVVWWNQEQTIGNEE